MHSTSIHEPTQMASQAAVDVLIEKGSFEPQAALAVVEAVDIAMTEAQIVTVPILDTRVAELKSATQVSLAHLEAKLDTTAASFDAKLNAAAAGFDAKLDAVAARFDAKLDAVAARFDARLDAAVARLEKLIEVNGERCKADLQGVRAELQGVKAELVRWVFVAMLGSAAIGVASASVQYLIQRAH
jgi:hypothetical protein